MEEKVLEINNKVKELSSEVESLVYEAVDDCCKDLNKEVRDIQLNVLNSIDSITNEQLHLVVSNLSIVLYFAVSKLEKLGIKEDISKKIKNEKFSEVKQETDGTVAAKEAAATLATQSEDVVLTVNSKAYKQAKANIESGYEILSAIKKVLSARISELELSSSRFIGTNVEGE